MHACIELVDNMILINDATFIYADTTVSENQIDIIFQHMNHGLTL